MAGTRSEAAATTLSAPRLLNLLQRRRRPSSDELCRAAAVAPPRSDDPSLRYPTEEYLRLWRAAMDRLLDPAFPLEVARVSSPASSDVLGFAFVTSTTIGAGLGQ